MGEALRPSSSLSGRVLLRPSPAPFPPDAGTWPGSTRQQSGDLAERVSSKRCRSGDLGKRIRVPSQEPLNILGTGQPQLPQHIAV